MSSARKLTTAGRWPSAWRIWTATSCRKFISAHDFGPDRLLHNESTPGHLKFTVLEGRRGFTDPKSCVLGYDSFKGMGCDFGDVNGDGMFDIYVSNIADKFALCESHFLWESTGKLDDMKHGIAPYVQASEKLGLSRSGWGWDCRLADFDNSGQCFRRFRPSASSKAKSIAGPNFNRSAPATTASSMTRACWPSFKPGADLSGQNDLDPFFVRAADGRFYNIGPEVGFTEPMVSRGHRAGRRGRRRAAGLRARQPVGTVLFLPQRFAQPRRVSRPAFVAAAGRRRPMLRCASGPAIRALDLRGRPAYRRAGAC